MPMPILSIPAYPFVPVMPGVPALARAVIDTQAPGFLAQAQVAGTAAPILQSMLNGDIPSMLNNVTVAVPQLYQILQPIAAVADMFGLQTPSATPAVQWGIFDSNGELVIEPDSILSLDWAGAYRIIKYPTEQGNFATYNKVQEPYEPRVVMRKGGTVTDRQNFIDVLNSIRADLELYTVITPETPYANCNITDVSYSRRADAGATIIEATVTLEQVNITASSSFTNVKDVTAQNSFDTGTVDTQTPTPTQAAAASAGPS